VIHFQNEGRRAWGRVNPKSNNEEVGKEERTNINLVREGALLYLKHWK
jgi:hypothetical protein